MSYAPSEGNRYVELKEFFLQPLEPGKAYVRMTCRHEESKKCSELNLEIQMSWKQLFDIQKQIAVELVERLNQSN